MKNLLRFLLLFLAIATIAGCAMRPSVLPSPGGISLQDICQQYNVHWQFDAVTQVIFLEYKDHKAKALVGSTVVLLGQQKIILNAPLRRQNSTIYVPDDFESKVIGPFGAVRSRLGFRGDLSNLKVHTIILDPGHGGRDPGARGFGGVKEKDVNLDIARRLRGLLSEAGLKVIMTRNSDEFISLNERTQIAAKSDADLFISIHANSNPVHRTEGMEVYYVKTHDRRDLDEEQRQKNERIFLRRLNAKASVTLQGIVADMMYELKVAESGRLAMRIVHDAASDLEVSNRGARHCRYFVVRNTLMPAVLIETGFLTNRQEEKKLNSGEYRQKLAEAIARSILTYASSS
ncbi:MAG: N-acetylmuramoyl-L-alanine amidase [Candidatus Omnitrophica bacterium]|nr:N-acetylmuramoyl-L-alanine amidase [Candidatus Omnitrophota bacterium]